MVQRFRRQIAVLWVGLLAACPLSGHEPPQTTTGSVPMEPATVSPWLDEVRAQRRAREERRRAAKEAMDARRRWIDPWGAAQQEAREQEVQRRRGAFLEQIEREPGGISQSSPLGSGSATKPMAERDAHPRTGADRARRSRNRGGNGTGGSATINALRPTRMG